MDDANEKAVPTVGDRILSRLEAFVGDAPKKKRKGRPKGSRTRRPTPPVPDFVLVGRDEIASWADALSEAAVMLSNAASCARSAKYWERTALTISRKVTRIRGLLAKKPE